MQEAKKNQGPEGGSKKKTRKEIEKKLEVALESLMPVLGEKKFRKRIKRAGKILGQDVSGTRADGSFQFKKTKATAKESAE
ncbi:MAG TPA: hypothetical protein VEV83_03125 [Parafilimonas sp.]|nr:hypothetical protein [Parafilimonas sp.]